ncbi:DUF364 domain-containing protein [Aminivibrio sp.]
MELHGRNCALPFAEGVEVPLSDDERLLIDHLIESMAAPEERVDQVFLGPKQIFLRAGSRAGLAASLGSSSRKGISTIESVRGKTLREVASLLYDDLLLNRSLGAAALNAGLEPKGDLKSPNALDLILDKGRGRDVVVVGDFPFTDRIRAEAGRLSLLELKDVPDRLDLEKWDEALASCDVAAITGTALLTRSMARHLKASPQAYQFILGATAPLSPVLINNYGADVLAGSVVVDAEKTERGVMEGLSISTLHRTGCLRFCNMSKEQGKGAQ